MNKAAIEITHYSDLLCIWAYIAQIRVEELQSNFADEVHVHYRFLQVFGDVAGKLAAQWSDRGGVEGYAGHVQEVAAKFDHVEINPEAWIANTPTSSLPAHLLLCGVRVVCGDDPEGLDPALVERVLVDLRRAFFVDLRDVSNQRTLFEIAEAAGVDLDRLQDVLAQGRAHAQLSADLATASQTPVRSSPTMIFNEGRQVLAGNVGYRVLEANIRELLQAPQDQQSWC